MPADFLQSGHAIHDIHCQAVTIDIVVDGEFERGIDVALLFVSTHMDVVMVRPPISQAVDELRITVKVEHDRFVDREQGIEVAVG